MFKLILFISMLMTMVVVKADDSDGNKKKLMDEFIRIIDAGKVNKHFTDKYTERYYHYIKEINPKIDPKVENIIREEISSYIEKEMQNYGGLNTKLYPIVTDHFSEEELEQIVKFYRTDVGKKAIQVIPLYEYQSEVVARRWAGNLAPELRQKISDRMKAENIQVTPQK